MDWSQVAVITTENNNPETAWEICTREKLIQNSDAGIYHNIHFYAREAGVSTLEKQFTKLFRKVAFRLVSGNRRHLRIDSLSPIEKLRGVGPMTIEMLVRNLCRPLLSR